ncbi:zinc finger CCCH domain-containing protein 14 isoform X2 [Armigeres subalbatus]|uniref:zinc finger CCCH domain-containing protein 14 isoform X2 n=1 Tax=Armigeres subalbatus TaxID=124917 RepID=UPI002ED4B2F1
MDSLGSEIGQKMRSAVKAKLIELGTGTASGYIDDELPDYVMIMVANKRSRQQMVDDLTLFLGGQTEVFVNWLHQVLQKLEEVTLPASSTATASATKGGAKEPVAKKKATDQKDKKDKKKDKKTKKKDKTPETRNNRVEPGNEEQHTPPHPASQLGGGTIQDVFANQFIQHAKKTMDVENNVSKKAPRESTPPMRDSSNSRTGNEFDIPTISEIAGQSAMSKHQKELSELEEIQQKIKQAKKQLRSMGSDESEDEDFLNIKANDEDLENIEDGGVAAAARRKEKQKMSIEQEKTRTDEEDRSNTPPPPVVAATPTKKKSIMERLGTRPEPKPATSDSTTKEASIATNKSNIISLSAHRREERELYVPVFRRKEMEEQAKAREARAKLNRSRSRERDRRRSPSGRSGRKNSSRSRDRSRSRRDRDRERDRFCERSRSRDRGRDRDRERDRDRSSGRVNNGTDVRTRIGSRVIVLPPKPEYNEEDEELEVPIASVVKIQPRPQVPKNKQPSKNLLLKAMAEAQRSTAANLKKTITNREESSSRHRRMLIEIPGAKSDETPPVDVHYEYEDDDEVDIVEHVLRDDDVDAELEQILNSNDEYIPEPVTVATSVHSDTDSDGHTPPPPGKSKPSIKDRIGHKVSPSDPSTTPPRDREHGNDDRAHQEALKRRKERFSIKTPSKESSGSSKRETSKSPEKRSKSSKKSPSKREKRSSNSNRKSSPNDLNELLLQRTKELLVDDSVSSSPIYMSKSDYEKIEPNSSSRKRKRVSPIQFALTDDEAEDTDGEYNHHRDRDHRERKSIERIVPHAMDDDSRKDQRRERDSERRTTDDDRRRNASNISGNGDSKSPSKKIKRLESSRKFDDVPQLLSSVSVSSDGLSKSKAIIKERCKYFPLCRQGDSCEFLHPSTNCKAFPACKFGDKCLYLHPMCKYDKTCHRLDCNYMHTKPLAGHVSSAPPLASSVVPVQNYKTITAKPLPQLCRFYPGCSNGDLCPYYHPKLCRFGKHCMNKVECNFYHYDLPGGIGGPLDHHEVPPKDKFKWVSPFSA